MAVVGAGIGRITVADIAGALRDEGVGGLGVAITFVLMAERAVVALKMHDIGPIGGIAIMAGIGMAGGAKVVGVVDVGFVEAVVAGVGSVNDDTALDHRLHRVQIAAAMGIVAGIALLDKGGLRGCAVTFVAMGADIFACLIRISVAASAEFFRFSPQAGIVSRIQNAGRQDRGRPGSPDPRHDHCSSSTGRQRARHCRADSLARACYGNPCNR